MRKTLLTIAIILEFVVTPTLIPVPTSAQDEALPITPQPDDHLCWDYNQPLDEMSFEEFIAGVGHGEGLYTAFKPLSPEVPTLGFNTYQVNPGEEVELSLQFFSPETQPQYLRYLVLLDEQQIKLSSDASQPDYADVTLLPDTIHSAVITIPPLTEGIHDVSLITVDDMDTPPTDHESSWSSSVGMRLSLVIGKPVPSQLTYERLPTVGSFDRGDLPTRLTLTLGDNPLMDWSYPEPAPIFGAGEPLAFNILAGYGGPSRQEGAVSLPSPSMERIALLAFIDFQQVTIYDNQRVLYGELSQDTAYTQIPITLHDNDTIGTHELLVVRIDNPRTPLCVLRGPTNGYLFSYETNYYRAVFEVE